MTSYRFKQQEIVFQYATPPAKREVLEKLLYDVMDELWQKTVNTHTMSDADKKRLLEHIRKKIMD